MRTLKYSLVILTSLFVSVAQANFYVGIGGGMTMGSIATQLTYPTSSATPTVASYNYSLFAFTPQFAVGYQTEFNHRWGLDTVLSADYNAGSTITKVNNWFPPSTNAYTNMSLPFVYALDVLTTYRMNAAVSSFFGPGIALAQFKSTADTTGGTIGASNSYSKNLIGAQLMAGVDLFLSNNCTLRLSDTFTIYPTVSTTWVEPISAEPFSGQTRVMTNTVLGGVYFYF